MPPPVNRKIFEQMMSSYGASDLNNARPAFDGRKNIFSTPSCSRAVRWMSISALTVCPSRTDPIPVFKVKIKKVATINLDELHRFLESKIMINVDVSATAFFQGIPLIEFVMKILGLRSSDKRDLYLPIHPLLNNAVERILKQVCVTTTHRGKYGRSFKILGLTKNSAKTETFKCPKTTASPHGPPEEEEIDLATANTIKNGLKILNYDNNEILRDVGMKISSEMAVIKARILPAPVISPTLLPRDGQWNFRDKKLAQAATLGSWGVVVFGTEHDCPKVNLEGFIRDLT
ncbi:Eukaryotic translation initiation factor 2C [Podila epicladia]|nr:Eukaryotic translation initiation factor 2C [Podila epicladia]